MIYKRAVLFGFSSGSCTFFLLRFRKKSAAFASLYFTAEYQLLKTTRRLKENGESGLPVFLIYNENRILNLTV